MREHVCGVAGDAMAAQAHHGFGPFNVVGQGHAAFTTGDDLHGVKTEDGDVAVAAIAHRLALVTGADGVGGVFNQLEAILHRQSMNGLHVTRLATHVNRHHHLGQLAVFLCLDEFGLQRLWAQVVGACIDVDKVDFCAAIQSAVGRGDKGDGAGPQAVAWAQAQGQAGQMQSRCGIGGRHGMLRLAISCHRCFKVGNHRPLCQKIGTQHLDHGLDVSLADALAAIGYGIRHHD